MEIAWAEQMVGSRCQRTLAHAVARGGVRMNIYDCVAIFKMRFLVCCDLDEMVLCRCWASHTELGFNSGNANAICGHQFVDHPRRQL